MKCKERLINWGKAHPKARYVVICLLAIVVFIDNVKKQLLKYKENKGKEPLSVAENMKTASQVYGDRGVGQKEKVLEQFRSRNQAAWVLVAVVCVGAIGITMAADSIRVPAKVSAQTRNLLEEREEETEEETETNTVAVLSPVVTEMPQEVVIDNDNLPWNLILINDEHEVPEDYQVNLVSVEGKQVDERIEAPLCKMLEDARKDGMRCRICSAYRTPQKQQKLVEKDVAKYKARGYSKQDALEMTYLGVSPVNHSEHQTGLTVDIVSVSHQSLDEAHASTKEAIWLKEHCHEYGFIVRYMEGKEEITHRKAESWHFRYVGVEAATEIMQNNLSLEEYLEEYLR